ncbi:hypothetical protein Saso_26360 [Streptomyces asoensis]|uniref:Uncharacterized protein n=1 Tax=Streptomyces asoensis TaxID=249586 RepID=A0ABQ3RYP4_9ACTN|nr:hypothetical protein GCM10010496_07940 [Streptomyces asoensis]GHI60986.1 hypothetical protein Saso_26360 [Streptomyces asoensis]
MPSTDETVRFIRSISLVIARCTTTLSTTAITRISSTRRPIASQVDQFCSTQLAAFVALSWASWRDGTVTAVGDSEGVGDGDAPAARRTAGKDTAGTSRCCSAPFGAAVKGDTHDEVTVRSPEGQNHHTNGALCVVR